jgi:tetratricopeptide (TPR) repeat protein
MRLCFATPVWGVNHLGLFLSIGLPSLLAPGNLSGLREPAKCRFLIYTRAGDEEQLKASAAFGRLTELMTVEIHRIEGPISNAHRTMSDCHADALRRADEDDAAAIFIPPDCVWSNGSMVRVEHLARSGKSMIHISGIRLDRDAVVPRLREYLSNDGCILEIAARPLVALGLAHLHRIALLHFWKEYPDEGLMPANLYWSVRGEGFALRCFHLHPLLVKPQVKFARFNSTIDDDLGLFVCPDHARDHVVTNSDEILAFELSGPERVISGDFQKNSIDSVAAWMEVGTNARHRLLAQHPIRIHSGAINEALWQLVERESEAVIKQALRIYALPSYAIARRHPAVVLWRYYAMTLGPGRYVGKGYRLARFTLRLSRRFVHINRRIRAIFDNGRATHISGSGKASGLQRSAAPPRTRLIDLAAAGAYQRRGDFKQRFGYLAGAVRDYNQAIELSPRNTALYFLRGTAWLTMRKLRAAAQDFEAALKLEPENQQLQSLLKHTQLAMEFEAYSRNPYGDTSYELRANLKRKLGCVGAAIRDYDKAIKRNSRNPAPYYLRGTARLRMGNAQGAAQDFEAASKLDHENEKLKWPLNDPQAAIELERRPNHPFGDVAYRVRGNFKRKLGCVGAAIRDYDKAIERNPRNPEVYYLRGTARQQLGNRDAAVTDFAAALKLDPENKCLQWLATNAIAPGGNPIAATRHQRRGDLKRRLGFFAAAIHEYDQAIEHNPQNPAVYYLRATARQRIGDREGAATDFAAALKLDPDNKSLQWLSNGSDAMAAARHQRRGDLKRRLGFFAAAIHEYDQAIEHNPQNPAVYYLRGTARQRIGHREDAAADFAAALKIDPDNKQMQWRLRNASARAVSETSLFGVTSPLLRSCFFSSGGNMRPSHPKWLFYRSLVSALLEAVRCEDRSVLILAEYGYFHLALERRRPDLKVEVALPEELADFRATGQWDVVIWNGLHRPSQKQEEDVLRILRVCRAVGSRTVCITPEPADRLTFQGVDEFRVIEARGTRLCYQSFTVMDRLRQHTRQVGKSYRGTSKYLFQAGELMLAMVTVGLGWLFNAIGLAMDLSQPIPRNLK